MIYKDTIYLYLDILLHYVTPELSTKFNDVLKYYLNTQMLILSASKLGGTPTFPAKYISDMREPSYIIVRIF